MLRESSLQLCRACRHVQEVAAGYLALTKCEQCGVTGFWTPSHLDVQKALELARSEQAELLHRRLGLLKTITRLEESRDSLDVKIETYQRMLGAPEQTRREG